jgi:hypothetical protein
MGMIIFPTVINELRGTYSVSKLESSPDDLERSSANDGVSSEMSRKRGDSRSDQDQAPSIPPSPASPNLGRLWINFKVPFDHAELQKKVINPYFPFNPNKEDTNGKQIFKSPLLKQSKLFKRHSE